jgi:hypothetical protein
MMLEAFFISFQTFFKSSRVIMMTGAAAASQNAKLFGKKNREKKVKRKLIDLDILQLVK